MGARREKLLWQPAICGSNNTKVALNRFWVVFPGKQQESGA